jgi:hypothetical protein
MTKVAAIIGNPKRAECLPCMRTREVKATVVSSTNHMNCFVVIGAVAIAGSVDRETNTVFYCNSFSLFTRLGESKKPLSPLMITHIPSL